MKYDKLEQAKARKNAEEEELDSLAKIYAASESMAEFRLKTAVYRNRKSKFMKWFSLFYFTKNYSIYEAFPWLVSVSFAVLAVVATGYCVEWMSRISKENGWQLLCAVIFIIGSLAWVSGAVLLFRKIDRMLDTVKHAVWKHE